jgi:CCR4-NOT transcription complex subunit 4
MKGVLKPAPPNKASKKPAEVWDCPLCMEPIDASDMDFIPCECGYQICRFCWHHIKTELNDKCPVCRRSYSEQEKDGILERSKDVLLRRESNSMKVSLEVKDNIDSKSDPNISSKRQNQGSASGYEHRIHRMKILPEFQHISTVRIVQYNLMYVVGIPWKLLNTIQETRSDKLKRQHLFSNLENWLMGPLQFGKYGKIVQIILNTKNTASNNASKKEANGRIDSKTISAFVTYSTPKEATWAIENVNGSILYGATLHAAHGTTKYCGYFLRGQECPNRSQCLFLHDISAEHEVFNPETFSSLQATSFSKKSAEMLSQVPEKPALTLEQNNALNFFQALLPNAMIHIEQDPESTLS